MKLEISDLKHNCDPALFDFDTTEDIEPLASQIIGQKRAIDAVELGLRVKQDGYNIFISGITGTGRNSYAKSVAEEKARDKEIPSDICYVYNFKEHSKPNALILPPGTGKELCIDMKDLIEELKEDIPKAFDSEDHEKKKSEIMSQFQKESNVFIDELEDEIKEDNFILQQGGQGTMPTPIPVDDEGNPITKEKFEEMPEDEKEEIKNKNLEIKKKIDKLRRIVRNLKLEAQEKLDELDKEYASTIIQHIFDNLKEKYDCCEEVIEYLEDVKNDIVENVEKFTNKNDENNFMQAFQQGREENFFVRYEVNLLVDHTESNGAPAVMESNPTYYNLFGKIEGKSQFGTITTDFTMIKSGAVHRANGGYLIINAIDILQKPFAWETLKRVLLNQKIIVENIAEQYRTVPITTLKPEPIDIDMKVILIGTPMIYQLLYHYDEEFKKLFKIKADFDIEMKRTEENLKKFAELISCICSREEIRHFTAEAVSRIIEYSSKMAESKGKLSTRFNEIVEILYESNAWADLVGNEFVEKEDVIKAIQEKDKRSNLIEDKIQEMIEKGHILIDVDGEDIGQINGLAVYQTGQYSFGRPTRITARTHLGQDGLINIEREAKMSGNIHNKAVLILSGYLGGKYAQDKPLSLSASLAFEQNYGGIEGDSASCAELIALLSSISGIPIKQSFAITGSMNQKGMIQPIGGVNEKIEGFFKVCQQEGFTGEQGVVIPVQNKDNLMLDDDVIEAVEEGEFSIYTAEKIDDAIEIIMGKSAGDVHKKVKEVLNNYAEMAANYGEEDDEEKENNEG